MLYFKSFSDPYWSFSHQRLPIDTDRKVAELIGRRYVVSAHWLPSGRGVLSIAKRHYVAYYLPRCSIVLVQERDME